MYFHKFNKLIFNNKLNVTLKYHTLISKSVNVLLINKNDLMEKNTSNPLSSLSSASLLYLTSKLKYQQYVNKRYNLLSLSLSSSSSSSNNNNKSLDLFEIMKIAILSYKNNNNLRDFFTIPSNFIVPTNDNNWPKETWGIQIGKITQHLRMSGAWDIFKHELEKIGFCYSPPHIRYSDFNKILAFKTYKVIYNVNGKFSIPQNFKIPYDNNEWPKEIWGMKLGKISHNIKINNCSKHYHNELEELGFDFNSKKSLLNFFDVYEALVIYKNLNNINGLFTVPARFIIPKENNNWPKKYWGMKLGSKTRSIKSGTGWRYYCKELFELGVDYRPHNVIAFEKIHKALVTYKNINNISGVFSIPFNFVIPNNDNKWPEEIWDMKLGLKLNSMRNNNTWRKHRLSLLEIGLDFKPQKTCINKYK